MMCFTLCLIKIKNKMQVDTFIFLLLYCLFGVYAVGFIYMVTVKEIVFECVFMPQLYTNKVNVIFLIFCDLSPAVIW